MKIWEKHLLKRLSLSLLFIFFCLCLLFICIDLSMHSVRFLSGGKAALLDIGKYYLYFISGYTDLFFSLSFLLASLKILFDLVQRLESVALQMAGISCQKLARPFILLAIILALFSYINAEWIAPEALNITDSFRNEVSKRKKNKLRDHLQTFTLKDGSEIIYQEFDPKKRELFDVFWVLSINDLWHMKSLELDSGLAHFADHLIRKSTSKLEIEESFEKHSFDLPLDPVEATQSFTPFENRSITLLLSQTFSTLSADLPMIRAHLHYKLSLPLLPLLIALLLPPILLRNFSRNRPLFFIVASSIFGLVAFLTLLDSLLILAENQVIQPSLGLWIPWGLAFGVALYRLIK